MPAPEGVTTFVGTLGPYVDGAWTPLRAGTTVTLAPTSPVLHEASGTVVLPYAVTAVVGTDGRATFPPLPHTGQGALTGFDYLLIIPDRWNPVRRRIAVPQEAGTDVRLDVLAPSFVPSVNVPVARGLPGPGVAPGGLPGQVLTKASQEDYDTHWMPAAAGGGSGGTEYAQTTPSASWSFTHTLGRRPGVSLYVAGVEVDADVSATSTQVSVVFPAPTAGTAVLT